MTALEILKGAREFLADEQRWTQNRFMKDDAAGNVCTVCLDGALYIGAGQLPGIDFVDFPPGVVKPFKDAQWRVANAISLGTLDRYMSIWGFNDAENRQHSDILEVLDKAIAAEEASL